MAAAVEILGVAHYRVEFADAVRESVARLAPAAIAVELPSTLEEPVLRAVRRLPQLSVVLYVTRAGEAVYLPVEPSDPIVEAIRSGLELGIPVGFVDLDVDDYPEYRERLPDPWTITRIGRSAYADAVAAWPRSRDARDPRREAGMVWRTARLAAECHGPVLLVCGLAHVQGVARALAAGGDALPLARVKREGVSVWNLDPECLPEVLGEMPLTAAVYELRRAGEPPGAEPASEPASSRAGPLRIVARSTPSAEDEREAVRRIAARAGAAGNGAGPLDRLRVAAALFDEAAARHQALTGQEVGAGQRRGFARFARRLAAAEAQLVPDLHDLVVAARGCVDDHFAWELWQLGSSYPWQRRVADLPTARISAEQLQLGARTLRLRPRRPRPGRRTSPLQRPRGHDPRGLARIEPFSGEGICSYPPEDLVVEDFGHLVRRRSRRILQDARASSEPFRVSIEEGVDVRETLRRWMEGELWVHRRGRAPGEVGNVVVIFDDDPEGSRYPFLLTWLGEHEAESDMALYASDPRDDAVAPGIGRARYGGFVLSHPPRRMLDVWTDPAYGMVTSKPERLVLAALDYSMAPHVALVARRPPSRRMRDWAAHLQRRLVYLPIGQLSPGRLARLRVLHVLDGRARRGQAGQHIS